MVSDYLALEHVRFEDRIHIEQDVADETLPLQVPPLLLQTLVENAVKYGIGTRPSGGFIHVVSRIEDGAHHLRVVNSGKICNRDGASTGLGLKNTRDRLQLIFGASASLRLFEGVPDTVTAEVVIPLRKPAESAASEAPPSALQRSNKPAFA